MFHGHLDYFPKPSLGGRSNTKPSGDHGTPNAHNRWFIPSYHVWGPTWINVRWNSIWLRAWAHMTSHYTWGHVTTQHDFEGMLGWPLDTFFWALTVSWSRLLAHVWRPLIDFQDHGFSWFPTPGIWLFLRPGSSTRVLKGWILPSMFPKPLLSFQNPFRFHDGAMCQLLA